MNKPPSTSRAALARDAALARLRRLRRSLIAASLALVGIFAGLAAVSTHPRKVVRRTGRTVQPQQASAALPSPQTTTVTPSTDDSSTPAAPAPAPPVQVPAPSSSPPVVVTGGS